MFEATRMLFIYVETPLHAGSGRGLGSVDLPIQRERTTCYPIVQGSGLKGCLRAAVRAQIGNKQPEIVQTIFGPEKEASEHAGALSVGDARILLFPVRSLAGVFAWTTSADALARFQREARMAGIAVPWSVPDSLKESEALVSGNALIAGGSVVLEEFSFTPRQDPALRAIGEWLANHALLATSEYTYWRRSLPEKLCLLPENAFRDFVQYATEVQTHVRLNLDTKTVEGGGLWTVESLPVDTLLYAPLLATRSRREKVDLSGGEILARLAGLNLTRTQLGGDETTGQGMVALRFDGGGA